MSDTTLQRTRETVAGRRAEQLTAAKARLAIERGVQSRTSHGRALFEAVAGQAVAAIDRRLSAYVLAPERAGFHGAALPVLASLYDPRRVVAVALPVLLDRITEPCSWEAMACRLGKALEAEVTMRRLKRRLGPNWMRQLKRTERGRLRAMDRRLLGRLGAAGYCWVEAERFAVGALVLDTLAGCGLFELRRLPSGETQLLPSDATKELIASCPPSQISPAYAPMVCPPRPWLALVGGGLLEMEEPLVRPPSSGRALPYATTMGHLFGAEPQMATVFAAVNALQAVELRMEPRMVEIQLESWQLNIRQGIWPAGSRPVEAPSRPISADPGTIAAWRSRFRRAKEQEKKEIGRRLTISRCLAEATQLAGRPIWQAVYLDHRGRTYTRNQLASHQGPDHQKALMEFGQGEPIDDEGARWLLIAAANHHGCGRINWGARASYGAGLIEQLRAIADDPLDRLDLWRGAADPWQFLQVALAWGAWEADKSAPVCCPVRFDQTTSGPGILAALLRDRQLATACNMAGSEPADLYLLVLAKVQAELQRLAFQGDECQRGHAVTLAGLVGRGQMKTAVMCAPYGASYLGLLDNLVDWLTALQPPGASFKEAVLEPAKFLAPIIWREARAVTDSGIKFRRWFQRLGSRIIRGGLPVQWTTPAGLLVSTGDRPVTATRVNTEISGSWYVASILDADPGAELSANASRRKLAANLIHSLDGSLVHTMASTAGAKKVPLITNHDCFATIPSRASWLHGELLNQTQRMYRPDLLATLVAEIAERGKVAVPRGLPIVGDLDPAAIGTNPYLYC